MENRIKLQKLLETIKRNNPNFGVYEKSEADYIKCEGLRKKFENSEIQFFAGADLHLSNEFILKATEKELVDQFDYWHDSLSDFRVWFMTKKIELLKTIKI